MFYDAVDDNYTCLSCGKVTYPEFVSVEAISLATGMEYHDLIDTFRRIHEPVAQGMVHKRAVKKLRRTP